jgi:PAS domain S-box-containing protein
MSLGIYAAYEKSYDFEAKNIILTQSISKHITNYITDAESALTSLSHNIARYDTFWFHWVLNNFLLAYPHYERLIYLDQTGNVLAAAPQSTSLLAMGALIDETTNQAMLISEPTISAETLQLVVYIGIRLKNNNILLGELNMQALQNNMKDLLPKNQGRLILTDSYGNLISHPDFSKVLTQDNIGNMTILREYRDDDPHTTIYKNNNVYRLGTISKVKKTDWRIIISTSVKEVFLPILSPLAAILTIILCLFFMFAHYLQYKLRGSVIQPLADFTEAIELTAKGKYQKLQDTDDHFVELAIIEQEFDKMITKINSREQEIIESEERFRQLVENIHEVFWINDTAESRFLYVSPSYEIIWGRTRESLYNNPESFFLAIDPKERFRVLEAFSSLQREGKIVDEEFAIILPDSKRRWIRAQSYPVYDDKGTRVRIVGVAEDITESKTIQNALMKAKQDAESASQAKTEFLTNMSHELRTPLNGIQGMLQLTQATPLNSEQADYIETALSSSKVLLNVINDILNIAQIEAGKLSLHPQLFSLHEVLETIFKFFKFSTDKKNLKLSMEIEPGIPSNLIGDDVRIRQVLFNLLGNSLKFTDEGRIDVNIMPLPISRTPDTMDILFTVKDTGIGIPKEKTAYIFESFTQVDGTYTRRYQGTGLGLGIVRSLVEYMNGTIAVDSEEGVGTTIYVTLQMSIPNHEHVSSKSNTEPTAKPLGKSLSILIVEDDQINQIAISRMLEKMGHISTCVGDGQKAIEILKKDSFDCVFMDIQMPIMDGIEATKLIRNSKDLVRSSAIPIIALTAHAMPEDKEKFLKVGMNDYLSKPVTFDQLTSALKRIK